MDSLITDPPAGISFMGKKWDSSKDFIGKMTGIYRECLRIMKPGAHGLVWAIPRTSHWTATALELAGFEIRDQICHLFGSGFPKSMDLDKQLRKDALVCMCNEYVETKKAKTNLSDMQNRIHPQEPNSTIEGEILQLRMHGTLEKHESKDQPTTESHSSFGTAGLDKNIQRNIQSKDVGQSKSSLEGGTVFRTGQGLCDDSQSGSSESEAQRLCAGAYLSNGETLGTSFESQGSGASHQPQYSGQSDRESKTLQRSQDALDRTSQRRLYCSECGKLKKEFSKGFGTNLKPAHEIWWLIRKPTSEDTVAKNVLKHGTGGLNIDASRIGTTDNLNGGAYTKGRAPRSMNPGGINQVNVSDLGEYNQPQGRFPSNLILSHNPDCLDDGWVSPDGTVKLSGCMPGCAVAELDAQSGELQSGGGTKGKRGGIFGDGSDNPNRANSLYFDSGGASRFFYCSKASKRDKGATNTHPTPKSTKLMQYLITLITPSGGTVLDPFMGSGSTGVAAKRLGFHFIGIEKEADYFKIAKERIDSA